ncbi:MAG: HisA/HisF family protein [Archaeoglobus sp.]|nr:HisA/HisF family protein [Archaeoglobus sp.]
MGKLAIYFVTDLLNGLVVRGVSGKRHEYRPIKSESSLGLPSSNPIEVVEFIKPKNLYVADLDKIMGFGSHSDLIDKLATSVDDLIADCGFKDSSEIKDLQFSPVLGTETFNIRQLERIERTESVVVSIDILDSILDASSSFEDWLEMVEFLNSFKLKGVIILTLKKVGTSSSLDWELLEKAIDVSANPVFGGGGVKSLDDLDKAKEIGCKALLVATAVHNRKIPLEVIQEGYF